jgi:glycosyltransferase involved in cell wall biosynthesis
MKVAGDWVFYLHALRGGKIAYTNEVTSYFRRYEGSTAERTYRDEAYFREVGMASRAVAALYNVPLLTLERCRLTYRQVYSNKVGRDEDEFWQWYDYASVLRARDRRVPNVMICTMGFYPGGAEILPIRLANEFRRRGLSVLMLSAGLNRREDGVRRMLRNDVPVVETSSVEATKAIIRDFGIECLNTHQWYIQKYPVQLPDVFAALRAHVASLHGMIEHGNAFKVTEEELRAADAAVTTWAYTAEKNLAPFREVGLYHPQSGRFIKIPNGMEPPEVVPIPRAELGIPEDAFVLCCVSRAIPDKGWSETIDVVGRARAISGRDIRLILVGNGPVYDDYCRSDTPDFVYLAGFNEDSVGHYAASDMGIMLTKFRSESFPLTVVDCLFAGRPYLASDVGDIRNMLTTSRGVAGALVSLQDWEIPVEESARLVAAFASDRARYQRAAALVDEAARRYRIDTVAEQYVTLFMESRGRLPHASGAEAAAVTA